MANVTVTLEGSQKVATGSSLLFKVTVTSPPNEPYLLTLWAEGRGQFLRNSFVPMDKVADALANEYGSYYVSAGGRRLELDFV